MQVKTIIDDLEGQNLFFTAKQIWADYNDSSVHLQTLIYSKQFIELMGINEKDYSSILMRNGVIEYFSQC